MGSGSSASPSRRYSSSGIETGSDAVKSERLVSPKDAVAPPFSSNDHTSRRLSQLNFTADKQLEGYNGILTSKTTVVNENSENELEINFKCVQLENNSSTTTPVVILANRKPRSGSQQFFNFYEIPILEKRNLCQSSDTNPASSVTYHLELDISLVGLRYDVADAIMILPENPSEEVETMAKFFHLDLDNSSYDFEADFNDFLLPFPAPFTIRKVLTCYLDLMGKPKKNVLDGMKKHVANENERQWLQNLLTGPTSELDAFLSSGTRYSKIFQDHIPSLSLSLEQLIILLPIMKPRTYTCACSPLVYPNVVHLCVTCHHRQLPSGEMWYGLCSSYIKRLDVGSSIKILHKKNGFDLPPLTTPVILIGIGSGIAPLRSIIQHRSALAQEQKIDNHYIKTILFYECNDPEEDFLYYDEICEANRNRSITTCHVAFSQRNCAYRTIQDLLKNPKIQSLVSDSIDIQGGQIFCSGNKDVVQNVEQSIVHMVMEKDGITAEQAREILQGAGRIYSSKLYVPG